MCVLVYVCVCVPVCTCKYILCVHVCLYVCMCLFVYMCIVCVHVTNAPFVLCMSHMQSISNYHVYYIILTNVNIHPVFIIVISLYTQA